MISNAAMRQAALACWLAFMVVALPATAELPVTDPETGSDAAPTADSVSPPDDSPARLAIKEVLASSEFTPQEKVTIPKWRSRSEPAVSSDGFKKVEAFFRWISGVLRAGVWVVGAIGVVVLLLTLRYWLRIAAQARQSAQVRVPTHVGGLDIRRESLPDNISQAARARCMAGDATGCLSLLYRGALSALVNLFACRILSSSTEDECVRLAQTKVTQDVYGFVSRLTEAWQLRVYAGRDIETQALLALCDAFDAYFAMPVDSGRPSFAAAGRAS